MAGALLAAPNIGWTQSSQQKLTNLKQSQATLAGQLQVAKSGKGPTPTLKNPATAPTIRTALDSSTLSLIEPSDLGEGFEVCLPVGEISQTYIALAERDGSEAVYRDEISLVLTFAIDCLGRLMDPLATFWSSLDEATQAERKSGVVLIRSGSTKMYVGGMGMLIQRDYSIQNKEQVLSALVRNVDSFASVMTPADRRKVVEAIDQFGPSAPAAFRPRLARLRAVFSRTACTGLCAI